MLTDSDARDDLQTFLTEPLATLPTVPKKVTKRRNTVCMSSPEGDDVINVRSRKVSRVTSNSKTAVSGNQTKSVTKAKEQTPIATAATSKCDGKSFLLEISIEYINNYCKMNLQKMLPSLRVAKTSQQHQRPNQKSTIFLKSF